MNWAKKQMRREECSRRRQSLAKRPEAGGSFAVKGLKGEFRECARAEAALE